MQWFGSNVDTGINGWWWLAPGAGHAGREAGVGLLLEAVDVDGPLRWRWLLTR